MPTSGVKVPDVCIDKFTEMKNGHNLLCIVYIIKDEKEFTIYKEFKKDEFKKDDDQEQRFRTVVQELTSDPNLVKPVDGDGSDLPTRNPCFIVWDFSVPAKSSSGAGKGAQFNVENDVLLFMGMCPDDRIAVKKKMLYASSIQELKLKLPGIMKTVEIKSVCELEYDNVIKMTMK